MAGSCARSKSVSKYFPAPPQTHTNIRDMGVICKALGSTPDYRKATKPSGIRQWRFLKI